MFRLYFPICRAKQKPSPCVLCFQNRSIHRICSINVRKEKFMDLRYSKYFRFSSLRCLVFLLCGFVAAPSLNAQTPAKEAVAVDLLITGGTIVTMDADRQVIKDGFIAVKGDTIVALGPNAAMAYPKGLTAQQTIDAKGKLILPGFINGHTHVPMVLMRGLIDDVTLDDWLHKYIFPAEARNVTEDYVRWGTRLAMAEMIRSGTTTFADMYYFEDAVAEETKAAGLRGFLGETWIDFPAPDNKGEADMAAYSERFLKKWQGDPLIHAGVAPHSIYTCSEK